MPLTPSPTELTTAATDAALAVVCLALLASLLRLSVDTPWKRAIWASVFVLVAISAGCGAVVHGLDLPPSMRAALWKPIYFSMGMSVALFLVGAIGDWRGEQAARAWLPWAVAAGTGVFVLTQISGSGFRAFIACEAAAMTTSFVIYLRLWIARKLAGAGTVAIGVALTLAAAAVQASSLGVQVVWPFDHNGLFHLIQIASVLVIANGLGRSLQHHHRTLADAGAVRHGAAR